MVGPKAQTKSSAGENKYHNIIEGHQTATEQPYKICGTCNHTENGSYFITESTNKLYQESQKLKGQQNQRLIINIEQGQMKLHQM